MKKKTYTKPETLLHRVTETQALLAGSELWVASDADNDYTDETLGDYWVSGTKDIWAD